LASVAAIASQQDAVPGHKALGQLAFQLCTSYLVDDYIVGAGSIFPLPPLQRAVPSVLDRVIAPTGQLLCYFGPAIAPFALLLDDDFVLLRRPAASLK
jgi:hypothetical protein